MVDHLGVAKVGVRKQPIPFTDVLAYQDLDGGHVELRREMLLPVFAKLRLNKNKQGDSMQSTQRQHEQKLTSYGLS